MSAVDHVRTAGRRADALALSAGSRLTMTSLMVAAVVVIVIGAQSMLGALRDMEGSITEMNGQLERTNGNLVTLTGTLAALPPTTRDLGGIVDTVDATNVQVARSRAALAATRASSDRLDRRIGAITESTGAMGTSLRGIGTETRGLVGTVSAANAQIGPIVTAQHGTRATAERLPSGVDAMNDRLAYIVRVLDYLAAPPQGGGFTVRADLPPETLPSLPGLQTETDPVGVFVRGAWTPYAGP